jgi:hypothetical protein
MNVLDQVDEFYAAFVESLPGVLAAEARDLAFTLRLAPARGVPWSRVFGHEVTLAAPALVAEAMPYVAPALVRDAVMAQAFAAIEAFGTDRIEDRQIVPSEALVDVLVRIRAARDRAAARVCGAMRDASVDFDAAHQRTLGAIRLERRLQSAGRAVTFAVYEDVSLGKQSVGFPPSMALALAAGWTEGQRLALRDVLESIWLGLQMPDDAVDWEDDQVRGGSWAVVVARGSQSSPPAAANDKGALRQLVWSSGVLAHMLDRAATHFRRVERIGGSLGAGRLASWGRQRAIETEAMAKAESNHAGYAARAHALIAWRREVLA